MSSDLDTNPRHIGTYRTRPMRARPPTRPTIPFTRAASNCEEAEAEWDGDDAEPDTEDVGDPEPADEAGPGPEGVGDPELPGAAEVFELELDEKPDTLALLQTSVRGFAVMLQLPVWQMLHSALAHWVTFVV